MLYIDSFIELVDILKEGAFEEDCKHASYVSNADDITALLEEINEHTKAKPEFVDFNNLRGEGYDYYTLSFDYEDGELRYSITPALDEDGKFYSDFGLCLVDECVPENFEDDYREDCDFIRGYESPIRIYWGEEPKDEDDCEKCTYNCDAPCCTKTNTEEKTKVDTDDKGKVRGFTKTWKDKNSYFTYSYHNTDENDVLDLMKRFKIDF